MLKFKVEPYIFPLYLQNLAVNSLFHNDLNTVSEVSMETAAQETNQNEEASIQ